MRQPLTLVMLNPAFANSVDPDQLVSETDLDLHCLPLSKLIYSDNPDQAI